MVRMTMRKTFTYKTLVLGLAALFALFNIGIPVVVAACPMAPVAATGSCQACTTTAPDNQPSIVRQIDTSCCATVIAAPPAEVAFIKGAAVAGGAESALVSVCTIASVDLLMTGAMASVIPHSREAVPSSDLTILLSSLLL